MPDRDYLDCPEGEIADISALLTMVGGKVVYATGKFATLDRSTLPLAMPEWSPVRSFGGYGAWKVGETATRDSTPKMEAACGCANTCGVHGHEHANAWSSKLPIADLKSFWGALGCACWAV